MDKRPTVLILVFFISLAQTVWGIHTKKYHTTLLRDGFILTGVEGKLSQHDGNDSNSTSLFDKWFFKFESDVNDGKGRIFAGTRLELLPSAALEKMIADTNNLSYTPSRQTSNGASYRLWARVTQYRGKNFIFPTYFLPLNKKQEMNDERRGKTLPTINEPNDVVTIPKELVEKVADRKKRVNYKERQEHTEKNTIKSGKPGSKKKSGLMQDSILAGRIGFIKEHKRARAQEHEDAYDLCTYDFCTTFVLNAIGRNIPRISLRLLPCQALEQAQLEQSAEPEILRFKIAGIVTEYKGEQYLLLQKATRVYSHGNFAK